MGSCSGDRRDCQEERKARRLGRFEFALQAGRDGHSRSRDPGDQGDRLGDADDHGIGHGQSLQLQAATHDQPGEVQNDSGEEQGDSHRRRVLLERADCPFNEDADHGGHRTDGEQHQDPPCVGVRAEAGQCDEIGPVEGDDCRERSQVQHCRGGKVRLLDSGEGRDEHEMATRRYRKELGQALYESPENGFEHEAGG